ncbi:MAG: hypothetical protein IJC69_06190 [Clostridia bacterium]|nr:hypothetical protein [Clostridia bacterium]
MKALKIVLAILSIPILLFEYFVFIWYWSGDGAYMLIMVPLVFAVLTALHVFFIKSVQKAYLKLILTASSVFLSPVFTILTVFFIAHIFNINIEIA